MSAEQSESASATPSARPVAGTGSENDSSLGTRIGVIIGGAAITSLGIAAIAIARRRNGELGIVASTEQDADNAP